MVTGLSLHDIHAMLTRHYGLTWPFSDFEAAKNAAFLSRVANLKLRVGARDALAQVDRHGARWAIVSNSDRQFVDANLRAVRLGGPGFISVSRNDVREGKPSPEPYLRAAYLLGANPADCIVVEDSPTGAHAGLAAGMQVVAWAEPHRPDLRFPPGCLMADPQDVASTLHQLLARAAA